MKLLLYICTTTEKATKSGKLSTCRNTSQINLENNAGENSNNNNYSYDFYIALHQTYTHLYGLFLMCICKYEPGIGKIVTCKKN